MSFHTIVGFFIPVSSLEVFGYFIHSERKMICLGKSMQALQNDTIIISWLCSFRVTQPTVQWQCDIPLKLSCLFSSILVHYITTFRDSRLLKYLINKEIIWLSVTRYKPKLSHGLTCHFMIDSLHWCAKTKELNKHAPGRVVIYISVHLVSIYTLTFSNVLLVLALNLIAA